MILLAISAPQHIYQLEVSLFFGDETTDASLMVHVPLVRNKQGMKLLHFRSFPIKDPVHDYEISINPTNTYLGLTPDHSYFIEMTASEVQLCNRVLYLPIVKNNIINTSNYIIILGTSPSNLPKFKNSI